MDIFRHKLIILPSSLDLRVDFDYGDDGCKNSEELDAVECEGTKKGEPDAADQRERGEGGAG